MNSQFYFIKSVSIKRCILPTSWQCKIRAQTPHPPLSTSNTLTEWRLKTTDANLKNVQSKRSDQENEADRSHGSKKSKDLSSEILIQEGTNLTRKERQGNFFFPIWFST